MTAIELGLPQIGGLDDVPEGASVLLDGERGTVTVDPDPIYVRDGPVATSAGVTAGIDLALALVEEVAAQAGITAHTIETRFPGGVLSGGFCVARIA